MNEWIVEPHLNQLSCGNLVRRLEPRAMDVLVQLLSAAPHPVSAEELMLKLWPSNASAQRKVAKSISQIRTTLEDTAREPGFIETVSKRGYRIVATVQEQKMDSAHPADIGSMNRDAVKAANWSLSPKQYDSDTKTGPAPEAKAAFQAAMSLVGSQDFSDTWLAKVTSGLEYAVSIDPEFSDAWATLALVNIGGAVWHDDEQMLIAKHAVDKALVIDGSHAIAHAAGGYVALLHTWEIDKAHACFEKAYELAPDDSTVLQGYHLVLRLQGKLKEAIQIAEKLHAVSAHDFRFRAEQIKIYFESRLYEEAALAAEAVRAVMPGYADFAEAAALAKLGRFLDSHSARVKAYQLMGDRGNDSQSIVEQGWSEQGHEGAMNSLCEHQQTVRQITNGLASNEFVVSNEHSTRLMALLVSEVKERRPWLIGLPSSPAFDELRTHREFGQLLKQMNLDFEIINIAQQADVARVLVFQGKAPMAIQTLKEIIDLYPDDSRKSRWIDSLAWAEFAMSNFQACLLQVDESMTYDQTPHATSFAFLLKAASLAHLGELYGAGVAMSTARESWPGSLDIERDLKPLFYGGSSELRESYLSGINLSMKELN